MKVIVGLGNVGEKYVRTRHNVGFMAVDVLSAKLGEKNNFIFLKPATMMNSSGLAVRKLIENYKLKTENLYVIHDDLDLILGEYKIQWARGPKVHKGVNSIEDALGTLDFWRVRIGVDNRDPEDRVSGEKYVLEDFSPDERKEVNLVFDEICKKLATS